MRLFKNQFTVILLAVLFVLVALPLKAQDDEVAVVMTRESGLSNQIVIVHTEIPWNDVRARYSQEYIGTIFSGGPGGWVTVISQGFPVRGQVLDGATSALLLQVKLDALFKEGHVVTKVEYGTDQWIMGVSEPLQPQRQQVLVSETFPKSQIAKLIKSGWSVTSVAWGEAEWIVILTEKTGYTGQQLLNGSEFPTKAIASAQKKGYRVTDLAQGEDEWVVVLTKGTGWGEQKIFLKDNYPTKEIDSAWMRGYHITSLAWSPSSTLPTLAFNNLEVETRLERVADLSSGFWYDEFIEKNTGTDYGFVAVQRMAGYYVATRQWEKAAETYQRYKSSFPSMEKTVR